MILSQFTEYDEQCAVIRWARLMVDTNQEPRLRLLRAGMEGLRLSIGTRVKAKKAGMDSDWPDLFLAVPHVVDKSCYFFGLFIELKRRKNATTRPSQKAMHQLLRGQGYAVFVCKGADAAIEVIKNYLRTA